MTEFPIIDDCCTGNDTVTAGCVGESYIIKCCPLYRAVNVTTIHACPRKEKCWVYRARIKEVADKTC